jgi:hypothetical protein
LRIRAFESMGSCRNAPGGGVPKDGLTQSKLRTSRLGDRVGAIRIVRMLGRWIGAGAGRLVGDGPIVAVGLGSGESGLG